jgi:signal transduction histidine kinase/ligand-binding sensor domain-containing protein
MKALVSAFLGVFCCSLLCGQTAFPFQHFEVADGLPNSNTGPIIRDATGYLWIGTSGGLARFDGYRFQNYAHQPSDSNSLGGNNVTHLLTDREGRLWIATRGGGLSLYQQEQDHFRQFHFREGDSSSLSTDYLNQIYQDSRGDFWICSDKGLDQLVWDSLAANWKFRRIEDLAGRSLQSVVEFPEGTFWLGTDRQGLIRWQAGDTLTFFRRGTAPWGIPANVIKELYRDTLAGQPGIWLATYGGLSFMHLNQDGNPVFQNITQKDGLPHNRVNWLAKDYRGTYWLATYGGGLVRMTFEWEKPRFQSFSHEEADPKSIQDDLLSLVYLDPLGILWAATSRGIAKLNLKHLEQNRSAFHHRRLPLKGKVNPSIEDITAILEDVHGNLWLGTYGSGMCLIPAGTQRSFYFWEQNEANSLPNGIVTGFSEINDSMIWVATFGGLALMTVRWQDSLPDLQFQRFMTKGPEGRRLSDAHIFALYQDENQVLWLGTRGGGLNRLDPQNKQIRFFQHLSENPQSISNDYVWSITGDGQGGLWLATDGGVNHFDPETEYFQSWTHEPGDVFSLSAHYVNVVFRDSHNRLWAGTSDAGLNLMIRDSLSGKVRFRHFREKDGLPGDEIYNILESKNGDLWISSPRGLSRFTPALALQENDNEVLAFRNFDKNDGLQDDEFNSMAVFQTREGKMYFGGVNGFNVFWPDSIAIQYPDPPLVFTGIWVMNEPVQPGKRLANGNLPLATWPDQGGVLQLNHKDRTLSIEFAALGYLFPESQQYAYRLEGFDPGWVYLGNEHKVSYTNLPAGDYQFQVRASTPDGSWPEKVHAFQIVVKPPPWNSGWAWALYILLALGLGSAYLRFRVKQREKELLTEARIEKAKVEERERVRKNAARDFHDELGNKMTKISLFVELAKREQGATEKGQVYLNRIEQNSQQLSEGLRDFIWILNPDQSSLLDVCVRLRDFGNDLFEASDALFKSQGIEDSFADYELGLTDRRHLVMLGKEAMHNALKYAQASKVLFAVQLQEGSLHMSIKDNGQGFDSSQIRKGYGLDNMRERAVAIQAEIQIESTPGQGTKIQVRWPLPGSAVESADSG